MLRDGYCKASGRDVEPCEGLSEWAHMHSHRRSRTVGQEPEERHTTAGSMMLCRKHHAMYDRRVLGTRARYLEIETLSENGANGPLNMRLVT